MLIQAFSYGFFSLWLIYCAWYDWKMRQIPNWLTFPAITIALIMRLSGQATGPWEIAIMICVAAFTGWAAGLFGGGDAKVTIAMALVSPYMASVAWATSSLWYMGVKIYLVRSHYKGEIRLPGAPGFALGGIAFLVLNLLHMISI